MCFVETEIEALRNYRSQIGYQPRVGSPFFRSLGESMTPVGAVQASVVQTSPSSQLGGRPPTHTPAEQASLVVQALPSLQGDVLLVKTQPVAGAHVSFVHTFR